VFFFFNLMGRVVAMAGLEGGGAPRAFDGGGPGGAAVAPGVGTRPEFPYNSIEAQRAGESIRAAAAARLSQVERGRLILSRLNGRDGTPALPPFLIGDAGTATARYDVDRRAVLIDRDAAVTALLDGIPAADRAARRQALARPGALNAALAADPAAVRRLVDANDALFAHELTHAWQDRRDPLWREMRDGHVPPAVVFEYEEEANLEKNLYIDALLRADPGASVDPVELEDYRAMMRDYRQWRRELLNTYRGADGDMLKELSEVRALARSRIAELEAAPVRSDQEQRRNAESLRGMRRGARAIDGLATAHAVRIRELQSGSLLAAQRGSDRTLARHFLRVASAASSSVERSVALHKALDHARASGDAALIEQIQSALAR
jgi:hypothetical protein